MFFELKSFIFLSPYLSTGSIFTISWKENKNDNINNISNFKKYFIFFRIFDNIQKIIVI